MDTVNLNLRGIPKDLRNQFKSVCAAQGKSMTEEIIRLMQETIKKDRGDKK